MTVIRLRANYSDEELQSLYSPLYKPEFFQDHLLRLATTSNLLSWVIDRHNLSSLADLACGNGSVVFEALENCAHNPQTIYLGDLSKENINYVNGLALDPTIKFNIQQGKIENTINSIEKVDLFVMTEILEHVSEPKKLLKAVREKTKMLLLSTPCGEPMDQECFNREHLWSWSRNDILKMLLQAGFEPKVEEIINFKEKGFPYDFQIWLLY